MTVEEMRGGSGSASSRSAEARRRRDARRKRERRVARVEARRVAEDPELARMAGFGDLRMAPSERVVDFSEVEKRPQRPSGRFHGEFVDHRPRSSEGKLLTEKQIRARMRRRLKSGRAELMTEEEFQAMYKPVEDWDSEELARGRPRNVDGTFRGVKQRWISAKVVEQAMERFKAVVRTEMNAQTITALEVLRELLDDDSTDSRGRPTVPASVKLQAATFLTEHVVGKPTQRLETDVSVKLQGILAQAIVNPNLALAPGAQGGLSEHGALPAYELAHMPGRTAPGLEAGPRDVVEGEVVDDD